MGDLAQSAVVHVDSWQEHQPGRSIIWRKFVLTLTGQGTSTNKILASVLGFSEILESKVGVTDTDANLIVAAPSLDGSHLLLKADDDDTPEDLTATLYITVGGR
jgi:hypothetical protein